MAINSTSIGISTISAPFNENIITMVNKKAIKVNGEIEGINLFAYQSVPFSFTKIKRLNKPNKNGIPK